MKYKKPIMPLGRWTIDKSDKQKKYWADWASADHCGVCDKNEINKTTYKLNNEVRKV